MMVVAGRGGDGLPAKVKQQLGARQLEARATAMSGDAGVWRGGAAPVGDDGGGYWRRKQRRRWRLGDAGRRLLQLDGDDRRLAHGGDVGWVDFSNRKDHDLFE
ncbi:unnamed protein product [Cuscuta campestris]|uniref:Uncharacterized protein n=1 Tax=Cuscuta campestris TaxID=132261 RepID=A0A484MRW2_9ASTE|nr:unnamed protein product [Cuscuta campestris]